MVYNAVEFIDKLVHNSLPKFPTKPFMTQQLMTTSSLNKTRLIPLMAQPYEVINVTTGNTGGTQDDTKPPDKPNG